MDGAPAVPASEASSPTGPAVPFLRLNRALDAAGVLLLGWSIVLAVAGAGRGEPISSPLQLPGSDPAAADGAAVHGLLVVALAGLALPLAVQVVVTFGRPGAVPGRRLTMAVPLIVGLFAVMAWRVVTGFILALPEGNWVTVSPYAGWLDGQALLVAAAATAGLVLRPPRLTRRVRNVAGTAAVISAAAAVVLAGLQLWSAYQVRLPRGDLSLALRLPDLLTAAVFAGLGAGLLGGLRRSAAWAAPGLCLWGSAVGLAYVVPQDLYPLLADPIPADVSAVVPGLDWALGAITVGAAVLLAPVVQMFRRSSPRRRAEMLSGAVVVQAALLMALLSARLFRLLILWGVAPSGPDSLPRFVFVLVLVAAGLAGCVVLLMAGIRLRRLPSQTLLVAGASLVILVQVVSLAVESTGIAGPWHSLLGLAGRTGWGSMPFDGYQAALTLVLPGLLVFLGARLRHRREQE